jgi:cytidylate kinase
MLVPEDSVRVDTEGRSIDEVIESIVRLVEERA